jgi:hypothetical protein
MIRARFVKAVRTQEDITYTLKGAPDKTAQHEAVDFEGNECDISLALNGEELKPNPDDLPDFIRSLWTRYAQDVKKAYAEGVESTSGSNLSGPVTSMHDKFQANHAGEMVSGENLDRDRY